MTDRLSLYNGALLICGERALASLTENREPRRLLDQAWAADAVDYCLSAGQWRWARRTVELAATPSVSPSFGYGNAFEVPADLVRTVAVCSDEYLRTPLLSYSKEQAYFFADIDPLYLSYISNDASYGGDYTLWPPFFVEFVEAYLARKVVHKITQDKEEWKRVYSLAKACREAAASQDAMEGASATTPTGSWASARRGQGGGDRGSRNQLIG